MNPKEEMLEFEGLLPDANMRPLRIRRVLDRIDLLPSDCVILRVWVAGQKVYDHEN